MSYSRTKDNYLRRERDRELFEAYTRLIDEGKCSSQVDVTEKLAQIPAPRFYIEPEFCHIVIGRMKAGRSMMIRSKQGIRKFNELYRRYREERMNPANVTKSTIEICNIIVNQPAPSFYLSHRSIRKIISEQRALKCKEMQRRLRQL